MPTFEIEQYEIHTQTYRIEAKTVAEAIKQLMDGDAEVMNNGLETRHPNCESLVAGAMTSRRRDFSINDTLSNFGPKVESKGACFEFCL